MGASGSVAGTTGKSRAYRCFLVRCRLEEGADPGVEPAWRFTVEQVRPDAARRAFASIHDVAAYIDAALACCGVLQDDHHSTHSEVKP